MFKRSGSTWSRQAKLTAAHGAANDEFGDSAVLSGSTAVVGAPGTNANTGAAYVFAKAPCGSGPQWIMIP